VDYGAWYKPVVHCIIGVDYAALRAVSVSCARCKLRMLLADVLPEFNVQAQGDVGSGTLQSVMTMGVLPGYTSLETVQEVP
jgi:hypothetical protein